LDPGPAARAVRRPRSRGRRAGRDRSVTVGREGRRAEGRGHRLTTRPYRLQSARPAGQTAGVRDDPIQRLLARPPDLPVVDGLAALTEALRARGVAVVQAPPGTGKTSLVPPAVAALRPGRVVVTQPRRIAARAAARRLAGLLGEEVGRTVGYAVRGDRRTGADTR